MASKSLNNTGILNGNYGAVPTELSSLVVTTLMIDGLSITKSADQQVWAGGLLTYTVEIANTNDQPLTEAVFTDTLDITNIALVANSVKIDGVDATYTYDGLTGLLTVPLTTLEIGTSLTVMFQVSKA